MTAPTIPAIETHYAGYRFRSRLEARWAVFFTALRVRWHYETQGYLIGEKRRPYLPDFWLPDLGVWVEVKGEMPALDMDLIDDAVSYPHGLPKSDPFGELCLLILGEIPEPGVTALHWMVSRTVYAPCGALDQFCACHDLHYSQQTFSPLTEDMLSTARVKANFGDLCEAPGAMLFQVGRMSLRPIWDDIVRWRPFPPLTADPRISEAHRAARSARFEHGEAPAVLPPPRTDPAPQTEEPPLRAPTPLGPGLRDRFAELERKHSRKDES